MRLIYEFEDFNKKYTIFVRVLSDKDALLRFLNEYRHLKDEVISLFELNNESFLKKFKPIYFAFIINEDDGERTQKDVLGIVGIDIPKKKSQRNVFIDIYINPKYRGMGYAHTVLSDLLKYICSHIKEHFNKKTIHATVDIHNESSIKALKKAGFVQLPKIVQEHLRRKKVLNNNEIRLVYYCGTL